MAKRKAAASGPKLHKVRTTLEPGKVIEVGEAELTDLERQGLIFDGKAPAEPEAPEGADDDDLDPEDDDTAIDDDEGDLP